MFCRCPSHIDSQKVNRTDQTPAQASEPLGNLLQAAAANGTAGKKAPRSGVALTELFYAGQLVRATVIDLQEVHGGCVGSAQSVRTLVHRTPHITLGRSVMLLSGSRWRQETHQPVSACGLDQLGHQRGVRWPGDGTACCRQGSGRSWLHPLLRHQGVEILPHKKQTACQHTNHSTPFALAWGRLRPLIMHRIC